MGTRTSDYLLNKYNKLALSLSELSSELGVEEKDIKDLIDNGNLRICKAGNKIIIPILSIESLLEGNLQISNGISQRHTVRQVLNEVLSERWKHVSSATKEWQKNNAKEIFNDLGERFIDEIKPKDIQAFLDSKEFRKNGKRSSERFIKGIKEMLGFMFDYARENDYINKDPMTKNIYLPKFQKCSADERYLSENQITCVLDITRESMLYTTIIKLLIMTGIRIGEALALTWNDVNEKSNIIHINKSIHSVYKEGKRIYEVGSTKTESSNRDIVVNKLVFDLLRKWKEFF